MRNELKERIIAALRREIEELEGRHRPDAGSVARLIRVLAQMPRDAQVRISGAENVGRLIHGAQLAFTNKTPSVYLMVGPVKGVECE